MGIGQHLKALGLSGDFFTWLSFISSANGDNNTHRVVVGLGLIPSDRHTAGIITVAAFVTTTVSFSH